MSPSPGSQKSKLILWQGPEAPGEGPSCLFQLRGLPDVPWLVATSLQPLRLSSPGLPVFLPIVFPLCLSGIGWGSRRTSPGWVHPIGGPCRPCGFSLQMGPGSLGRVCSSGFSPGKLLPRHTVLRGRRCRVQRTHTGNGSCEPPPWGQKVVFIIENSAGTFVSSPSGIHLFLRWY